MVKSCVFQFNCVEAGDVKILLRTLLEYGSAGTDNLDSKVLNIAADLISGPFSHILNRCLLCGEYPRLWKEEKIIQLLKDNKLPFSGPKTVIQGAITNWNNLPLNIHIIKIKSSFKKNMQKHLLACR